MSETAKSTLENLQQENAALRQRLHEAQKMAALGELLGTTTHEFNNILTTVINYAKMGLRRPDNEVRDKALQKILTAGQRAAKISHVVMGLAKRRSETFEPTDLAELMDDTLLLLERELNKYRIQVERYVQPAPKVVANAGQLQRVLLNLIVNARQAMPDGGKLIVKLSADPSGEVVNVQLRDTGCGIAPDKLPHIFDSYFTTKSGPDETGKGGTGLGLAVCREIIEGHQGRIRVESAIGKGTSFTLKFPVAHRQPAAATA